jgi:hypothetical protein
MGKEIGSLNLRNGEITRATKTEKDLEVIIKEKWKRINEHSLWQEVEKYEFEIKIEKVGKYFISSINGKTLTPWYFNKIYSTKDIEKAKNHPKPLNHNQVIYLIKSGRNKELFYNDKYCNHTPSKKVAQDLNRVSMWILDYQVKERKNEEVLDKLGLTKDDLPDLHNHEDTWNTLFRSWYWDKLLPKQST